MGPGPRYRRLLHKICDPHWPVGPHLQQCYPMQSHASGNCHSTVLMMSVQQSQAYGGPNAPVPNIKKRDDLSRWSMGDSSSWAASRTVYDYQTYIYIRIEKHLQCGARIGRGKHQKAWEQEIWREHHSNPLQRHSHVHFCETF